MITILKFSLSYQIQGLDLLRKGLTEDIVGTVWKNFLIALKTITAEQPAAEGP